MAKYREAFARYYDALTRNVDYAGQAAFLLEQVSRWGGSAGLVLDLACGTGSLAVELAGQGADVIAVDGSRDMLSSAVMKSAGVSPPVLFLCQEMEALDLYGTVETAFCTLDSLNHLSGPESLDRVLDRLRLFVEPGGLFLFDLNTRYKHRQVLGNNVFVYETPEVYCVWQNALNGDDSVDVTLDFFVPESGAAGGYTRYEESFREVIFPRETVAALLEKNGFSLLGELGDYEDRPPGPKEERVVFVTRRR